MNLKSFLKKNNKSYAFQLILFYISHFHLKLDVLKIHQTKTEVTLN